MDRILRLGSGGIPGVGQVSKSIVVVLYVACISPQNNLSLSFLCYHHHFGRRVSCETFYHSAEKFVKMALKFIQIQVHYYRKLASVVKV